MATDNDYRAFPQSNCAEHMRGMTLRDFFAAKALPSVFGIAKGNPAAIGLDESEIAQLIAEASYQIADAMLAAREAK